MIWCYERLVCENDLIKNFLKEKEDLRDLTVTGVQTCALPISRYCANNFSITFSESTGTSRTDTTSPSLSLVLVRTPSCIVTAYVLSASNKYCVNFVASPKKMGNMPVASGSSVPACPAFFA